MYGPASVGNIPPANGGRGSSSAPPRERQYTPRGQMSGGANQRPPLLDLPPHLRVMFEPRPPLEFRPPITKRESQPYSGVSSYIDLFENTPPPPREYFEPPAERKKRVKEQLKKLNDEKNELMLSDWNPHSNPKATGNAYTTLFVGRLSYDTTDKKLRREFEQYGPIKSIRLVQDLEGSSRGYAFIEFEKEEDLTSAYKRADGKKIDGRRIVVDVERGRTVRNWKPRRLGGGLGGRKALKSKKVLEEEARKMLAAGGLPPAGIAYVPSSKPADRPPDRISSGPPPQSSESRHGSDSRSSRHESDGRNGVPPSNDRYGPPPSDRHGPPPLVDRYGGSGHDRHGGPAQDKDGGNRLRERSRDRGERPRERMGDRDREPDRDSYGGDRRRLRSPERRDYSERDIKRR